MKRTIDHREVTGVILCGGAGRRMGNRDKGLLSLAGRPFIDYVIERLAPQVASLAINTNLDDDYHHYRLPIVHDDPEGGVGPLAGLHAALRFSSTEWVVVAPCDTPRLPEDLVVRMGERLFETGGKLCSVSDGERIHGVIMLAHRTLADSVASYLDSGERRVQRWLEQNSPAIVDFADRPDAFINLNTPEQLARLEETL